VLLLLDGGGAEAGGELLDGWCTVICLENVLGRNGIDWLGRLDLGGGDWATFRDVDGQIAVAAGSAS